VGQWLEACTVKGAQMETKAGDAYRSYQAWCEEIGTRPLSMTAWGRRLAEKGLSKLKTQRVYFLSRNRTAEQRPLMRVRIVRIVLTGYDS